MSRGRLLPALASVATLAWVQWVEAHDLEIDRLRVWRNPDWSELRGQITFDPQLTRDEDAPPPSDARERIAAFLDENLAIELGNQRCTPQFDVRELYRKGGAAPGDVVMLRCPLAPGTATLRVHVGDGFPALAVRAVGFDQQGSSEEGVIVSGGGASPSYSLSREGEAGSVTTSKRESGLQVFAQQVLQGFVHILPKGWDHVLFVLGLALGCRGRYRQLLLELSAFTVAHTCTLALGALELLVIPGHIVEPVIALSICWVALENVWRKGGQAVRLLVAFAFGLIHGQGFAGVLAELGLPKDEFVAALLGFNVGVELGQVAVVLLLVVAQLLAQHAYEPDAAERERGVRWTSIGIAFVGAFWAVERVLGI